MAGNLPSHDNIHAATETTDNQIPMLAVTLDHGQTVMFTVESRDEAGNIAVASPPPLTIDITPPIVEGFK